MYIYIQICTCIHRIEAEQTREKMRKRKMYTRSYKRTRTRTYTYMHVHPHTRTHSNQQTNTYTYMQNNVHTNTHIYCTAGCAHPPHTYTARQAVLTPLVLHTLVLHTPCLAHTHKHVPTHTHRSISSTSRMAHHSLSSTLSHLVLQIKLGAGRYQLVYYLDMPSGARKHQRRPPILHAAADRVHFTRNCTSCSNSIIDIYIWV